LKYAASQLAGEEAFFPLSVCKYITIHRVHLRKETRADKHHFLQLSHNLQTRVMKGFFVAVCCSVLQCVAVQLSHNLQGCTRCSCAETHLQWVYVQRNATYCNILQHAATRCRLMCRRRPAKDMRAMHCNTLQKNTLQHTAAHCNTLQHTATRCLFMCRKRHAKNMPAMHCNTLQHTATYCDILHHTAAHCNIEKAGVTADRDKIEFRLFNSSSIFNTTLREELLSSPKQNQPWLPVLFSWR